MKNLSTILKSVEEELRQYAKVRPESLIIDLENYLKKRKSLGSNKIKIATFIKKESSKITSETYFTDANFLIKKDLISDWEATEEKIKKYPINRSTMQDKKIKQLFDDSAPLISINFNDYSINNNAYIYQLANNKKAAFNKNYVEKIIKPLIKQGATAHAHIRTSDSGYLIKSLYIKLNGEGVAIVMPIDIRM